MKLLGPNLITFIRGNLRSEVENNEALETGNQ